MHHHTGKGGGCAGAGAGLRAEVGVTARSRSRSRSCAAAMVAVVMPTPLPSVISLLKPGASGDASGVPREECDNCSPDKRATECNTGAVTCDTAGGAGGGLTGPTF